MADVLHRYRTAIVVLAIVAVGLTLLGACGVTVCPFASLFGIPCPGCGLTRAALSLAQGHWRLALHYHPLSPVIVPAFGTLIAWTFAGNEWAVARGYDPIRIERIIAAALTTMLLSLFFVWIARFWGAFGGPVHVPESVWVKFEHLARTHP